VEEQKKGGELQQKQTYESPRLIFYGDITEITESSGGTKGMNDGGGGKDKTGF
jgi:hypothetical protein